MTELKTKKNRASVTKFLKGVENEQRRKDGLMLLHLFKEATKMKPSMWGESIIGFGEYHYKYKSGQEGDWPITGFSPRKQNMTVYIMTGFYKEKYKKLLTKLGKHKTSVSCIYIKKLEDINTDILKKIIKESIKDMKKHYDTKH